MKTHYLKYRKIYQDGITKPPSTETTNYDNMIPLSMVELCVCVIVLNANVLEGCSMQSVCNFINWNIHVIFMLCISQLCTVIRTCLGQRGIVPLFSPNYDATWNIFWYQEQRILCHMLIFVAKSNWVFAGARSWFRGTCNKRTPSVASPGPIWPRLEVAGSCDPQHYDRITSPRWPSWGPSQCCEWRTSQY